jgi:hypothetical protein
VPLMLCPIANLLFSCQETYVPALVYVALWKGLDSKPEETGLCKLWDILQLATTSNCQRCTIFFSILAKYKPTKANVNTVME